MDGEPHEGTFKDADGKWWVVQYRHHPRKRLTVSAAEYTPSGWQVDKATPDLTPEKWSALQGWL